MWGDFPGQLYLKFYQTDECDFFYFFFNGSARYTDENSNEKNSKNVIIKYLLEINKFWDTAPNFKLTEFLSITASYYDL